jgi:hypothetical protein
MGRTGVQMLFHFFFSLFFFDTIQGQTVATVQ